jgi:L-glutamine-phosphate cytidylyltransferase
MIDSAVVLAAGRGTRIAEVTRAPKCLLEVRGKSLIRHHVDHLAALGFREVVVVVGYQAELVQRHLADHGSGLRVEFVENEDVERFGNAASLCLGLQRVTGPCIAIDGDLIYERAVLERFLRGDPHDSILVGLGEIDDIESTKALVDCLGRVTSVVDKRLLSPNEQPLFLGEAMGVLMFTEASRTAFLRRSDQFFEAPENLLKNWEPLLNDHLQEQPMTARFVGSPRWIEIDTPQDYAQARRIFENASQPA